MQDRNPRLRRFRFLCHAVPMIRERVKAAPDRVLTGPTERQEDVLHLVEEMEELDAREYRLSDEQVPEIERRMRAVTAFSADGPFSLSKSSSFPPETRPRPCLLNPSKLFGNLLKGLQIPVPRGPSMNAPTAFPDQQKPVPPYKHTPLFPLGKDTTPYKKITSEGVSVEKVLGKEMLVVSRDALKALSEAAFGDINHYLRPGHLQQLRNILDDSEASPNDKFVAFDFLKNANIAAGGVLPMCQDTGTAIIMGKKGARVITDGDDEAALSEGARDAYLRRNLRYSQVAPLSMYEEKNTANNMPAQCEIYAEGDDVYKFMFMAKGGGSANKSFLFQATPSVLTKDRLLAFLKEKIMTLGTAACPPYHLAIVIGGTSA